VTGLDLEERHEEGMLRAVKACLIHNTLLGEPSIEPTSGVPDENSKSR